MLRFSLNFVVSGIFVLRCQTPQPEVVLHVGTQEVLLDLIVRDKHQNVVKDLRPEEVEIYEDGQRQTPRSFLYRDGKQAEQGNMLPAPSTNAATKFDPLRQINIVSIVFESMGPESRLRATRFVHEFLQTEIRPNTWMGVFTLRNQLTVIQPYTNDLAALNKAVDRAGTGSYQQFAKENNEIVQRLNSLLKTAQPVAVGSNPGVPGSDSGANSATSFQPVQPGSAAERGPAGGIGAAAVAEARMQQLTLRILFQQEGSRSLDALRRLLREQSQLPGRKTVLYVSEGLAVPPEQPEQLRSVISEANRGNITFYTLDARGLDTSSPDRISNLTTQALNTDLGGADSGAPVQQTNLQENARELASGTGGFAMANSNDLRGSLRHVMEDIDSHYEVTYSPTSTKFDGHYRVLEVKLARPGLKVQSRRGYYALPLVNGETLSLVEVAALNALNSPTPRHDFEFHAAALRFHQDAAGAEYRMVFAVPSAALHFTEVNNGAAFRIRVSAFGLIKGEDGQFVQRLFKEVPFEAAAARRVEFAQGVVTVELAAHLAPGRYRFEAAMLDREAGTAGVRKIALIVPAVPTGADELEMSDFLWVRGVQSNPGARDLSDPLDTASGKVTPELDSVFPKTAPASFFFLIYPKAGAVGQPALQIALRKDGANVAIIRPSLPPLDTSGAIPVLGQIPVEPLESGDYEVIVDVTRGGEHVTRRAAMTVK